MMPRNNLGSSTLQGPGWSRVLLSMLSHIRSDNSTLRTSHSLDPTNKNGMQWSPVRTFGRILLAVHSSSFSPGYHIKSSLAFFPLSIKRLGNACGLFNSYPSKQVISCCQKGSDLNEGSELASLFKCESSTFSFRVMRRDVPLGPEVGKELMEMKNEVLSKPMIAPGRCDCHCNAHVRFTIVGNCLCNFGRPVGGTIISSKFGHCYNLRSCGHYRFTIRTYFIFDLRTVYQGFEFRPASPSSPSTFFPSFTHHVPSTLPCSTVRNVIPLCGTPLVFSWYFGSVGFRTLVAFYCAA